jgi:hypothetical protein
MTPMNNGSINNGKPVYPIMQLLSIIRNGGNPAPILNLIVQQNPLAGQMIRVLSSKSYEDQRRFVENLCKERGTTVEDVARSLGIAIPSQR